MRAAEPQPPSTSWVNCIYVAPLTRPLSALHTTSLLSPIHTLWNTDGPERPSGPPPQTCVGDPVGSQGPAEGHPHGIYQFPWRYETDMLMLAWIMLTSCSLWFLFLPSHMKMGRRGRRFMCTNMHVNSWMPTDRGSESNPNLYPRRNNTSGVTTSACWKLDIAPLILKRTLKNTTSVMSSVIWTV